MKDGREFIVIWGVNSLIFYFTPLLLTDMVATGNARLTSFMASLMSGFLLTLIVAATQPAFTSLNVKLKDYMWLFAYLFVNVLGIWLIARYADLTGFGVANAWVAVILGIVCTVAQWGVKTLALGKNK